MAEQKPLVVIAGQTQQLPAGDSLPSSSIKWSFIPDVIEVGETVTVPANRQLLIARELTNSGTLMNDGKVFIL